MPLLLESLNHFDGAQHVECQISLNGLRGPQACTSPEVMAAVEALKDACRTELSGPEEIGGKLAMAVEKRPEPVTIEAEPVADASVAS
jgi:hypothetical protein